MILIGIRGLLGSGKTSLAKELLNKLKNSKIQSFAGPIKSYLKVRNITKENNLDDYRRLAQFIGARFRKYDIDYWVKCWKDDITGESFEDIYRVFGNYLDIQWEIELEKKTDKIIIADDVRYMNEVEIFKNHGILIHIKRPGIDITKTVFNHESEELNKTFTDHGSLGMTFTNDSTIENLSKLVIAYLKNKDLRIKEKIKE